MANGSAQPKQGQLDAVSLPGLVAQMQFAVKDAKRTRWAPGAGFAWPWLDTHGYMLAWGQGQGFCEGGVFGEFRCVAAT